MCEMNLDGLCSTSYKCRKVYSTILEWILFSIASWTTHAAHKNPQSRLKLPVPKWLMFVLFNLFAKVCEQCQIIERYSMFCVSHLKASKQGKTILYIGFKWLFLKRLTFKLLNWLKSALLVCTTGTKPQFENMSSQKCRAPAKQVFPNASIPTKFAYDCIYEQSTQKFVLCLMNKTQYTVLRIN